MTFTFLGLNEYCPWTNRCAGLLALSHLVAVPGLLPVSVSFAVLGPATVLGHITVAGLMTGPSSLQLAGPVCI